MTNPHTADLARLAGYAALAVLLLPACSSPAASTKINSLCPGAAS